MICLFAYLVMKIALRFTPNTSRLTCNLKAGMDALAALPQGFKDFLNHLFCFIQRILLPLQSN